MSLTHLKLNQPRLLLQTIHIHVNRSRQHACQMPDFLYRNQSRLIYSVLRSPHLTLSASRIQGRVA
ncbi:protein of unknown function [Cupriavidus taiwanensis]|uniref:Uncharacterized protein n=1 Tax=Cupriavidus taiwanensis TaxID=164546 RepID=A0A9Q7XP63_9BURK|nr:protein of unknown function [Cupriavidus taiwanensis]